MNYFRPPDKTTWLEGRMPSSHPFAKMIRARDLREERMKTDYTPQVRHLYRAAIRLMSGAGLEAHDFPCGCCVCEMAAALAMLDMDDTMMQPEQALVNNLAMLVRRMAHRLSKHKEHVEDAKLAEQAIEFLRVNALLGSMLR